MLAPLPKPLHGKPSNRFLYAFLSAALFALITSNYPMLFFSACVVFVFFSVVAVHELGHLVAGWLVALRFQSVSVGSLWFIRENRRFRIQFKRQRLFGQTNMALDRLRRVRKRMILFTAGGPIATVLGAILTLCSAGFVDSRTNSLITSMYDLFVYLSFFIVFLGLLPLRYANFPSDALMLKWLLTSVDGTKHLIASHALEMQKRNGVDPMDLNARWVGLAFMRGFSAQAQYAADWRGYTAASANDPAGAATWLEKCLAGSSVLNSEQRDHLIAEAAYFAAWQRKDSPKAEAWLGRVAKPENIHRLEQLRIEVALAAARDRYLEALEYCQEGIRFLERFPVGTPARMQEAVWRTWLQHIEKLQSETVRSAR